MMDTINGSSLIISVPHAVKGLLNSYYPQYLSAGHLTSHDIFLLTISLIALVHCNNLSPATLLPSPIDKTPHHCLIMMGHLLTHHDDLAEPPFDKCWFLMVYSWLLPKMKMVNSMLDFWAHPVCTLTLATSTQQIKFHAPPQASTLAKGKTINTHTDSEYAFGVAYDVECYGHNRVSFQQRQN